jgi:hypothetical protein
LIEKLLTKGFYDIVEVFTRQSAICGAIVKQCSINTRSKLIVIILSDLDRNKVKFPLEAASNPVSDDLVDFAVVKLLAQIVLFLVGTKGYFALSRS